MQYKMVILSIIAEENSLVQISNNGALDVGGPFTWMAYVYFEDITRNSPLFVWMPNDANVKNYASGLVARMKDGIITYHMSLVSHTQKISYADHVYIYM